MAQAINNFNLTGRLTATPEMKSTASGKNYIVSNIAVKGIDADHTDFISFFAWGKLATIVVKYCGKGDLISVHGFITTYQKDDHNVLQLTADNISFLSKASTKKESAPEPEKKPAKSETDTDPFANANFEPISDPFANL